MANINAWSDNWAYDGATPYPVEVVVSETRPSGDHHPVANRKRVHGSRYTPYTAGSKEWRDAANRALSSWAQSNFQNGKR